MQAKTTATEAAKPAATTSVSRNALALTGSKSAPTHEHHGEHYQCDNLSKKKQGDAIHDLSPPLCP
jgi:hypothetical protein